MPQAGGVLARERMERETGIEPVTSSLGSWRSTAELLPLNCKLPHPSLPLGDSGFRRAAQTPR